MRNDINHIWSNCLDIIRDNVKPASFKTWFEPIKPMEFKGRSLVLQVPSAFFYEYLEEHYIDILRQTLREVIGEGARLEYNVVTDSNASLSSTPRNINYPASATASVRKRPVTATMTREPQGIRNPFIVPGIQKLNIDPQLLRHNTFDNYIEGGCNRLARSAGQAVAENPGGTAFNPLMIYGESGFGKTHLIQAIGLEVKRQYPEKVVLYVNANKFITQYSEATRNNNRNDFMHFYQMIDVLIVDDVQELAGKEKTQETFFHIFNHLHQSGKQIILSSDKPPVELKGLEKRLLSRFKWGLTTDLTLPDHSTRLSILKSKVYKDGIQMSDAILNFLADNVTTSVRELEGTLVSLLAHSTLTKRELTIDLAREMVGKLVRNTKKEVSIDSVQKEVCSYFKMPLESLQAKSRKRQIVQARQIAMYLSKNLTNQSLSTIGSQIGRKDHATVLHACKIVGNLIETDMSFRADVETIKSQLI